MRLPSGGSEPPASSVPPNPRTLRGSRTLRLLILSQVHMPILLSGQKENRLRYADGLKNSFNFRSLYTEICLHSKILLVSEEEK